VRRASCAVLLSLLLVTLIVLSLDIQPTKANTLNVPGNYATIQEAINHASEGDMIHVSAGVYDENIVVNKTVVLIGDNQKTQITGRLSDSVRIEVDNVTFLGFNISAPTGHRGVVIESSSHVKIAGNVIGYMMYDFATGIFIGGGGNNSIVNNRIDLTDGIAVSGSANNLIMGNYFLAYSPVRLHGSNHNHIVRNWLCHTGVGGDYFDMWLDNSNGNTIEQNTFTNLGTLMRAHVYLEDSTENLFFHNSFEYVKWAPAVETYWNTSNTLWDNGSEGNYWAFYEVDDLNGDGIGDTPYIINEDFTDNYPLMQRYSWWNPSDINGDFAVNIFDIVLLCGRYGSTAADSDWNWLYDIAEPYGKIDIFDLVTIAGSYGKQL
jgi:nitrous oxidase accessory protein NosD